MTTSCQGEIARAYASIGVQALEEAAYVLCPGRRPMPRMPNQVRRELTPAGAYGHESPRAQLMDPLYRWTDGTA